MGFLSIARDDRVVLVGISIATAALVAAMHSVLAHLRDEVEIRPPQPKTQYITQETEDALTLGTLDTLLAHYNYAIRETSAKIVVDRAVNDGATIDALLFAITRPDYDVRIKNLRALAMVTDHRECSSPPPFPS